MPCGHQGEQGRVQLRVLRGRLASGQPEGGVGTSLPAWALSRTAVGKEVPTPRL